MLKFHIKIIKFNQITNKNYHIYDFIFLNLIIYLIIIHYVINIFRKGYFLLKPSKNINKIL